MTVDGTLTSHLQIPGPCIPLSERYCRIFAMDIHLDLAYFALRARFVALLDIEDFLWYRVSRQLNKPCYFNSLLPN